MKKLVFLIAIFCVLKANSQPYLITFAGTGVSTIVSTVKVENLTASTTLTLNGSDILRLTTATGVNSIDNNKSSGLKIYPNPMVDYATLEICPPVAGDALITVYEMTGKPIAQIQSYLNNGRQEFRFSGFNNGVCLIIVKGNGYQLSGKLLCYGKSNGTISLEKISNNQTTDGKIIKMDSKGELATVDMNYTTGNVLKITGFSGNYSATVTDIPTSSKTITFSFVEPACALVCNIGTQSYSISITCESGTISTTYHGQSTQYQYDNNGKLIGIKVNLNQTRTYLNTNNSYTIVGVIEINLNQNTETHNITVSGGKFQYPQTCS